MMTDPKRYLITSALPYANGPKHIGHLAGAYLPADIYVRYLRAKKKDVVYVCGSDEHGAAITIQAMKEGTTPRAIVDKYHAMLQSNMADLGITSIIVHQHKFTMKPHKNFLVCWKRMVIWKCVKVNNIMMRQQVLF
jgi:methionyl-tRNA synthetase